LLDIVPDYRFAVGVGLHRKQMTIDLVNLKLERITKAEVPTSQFSDPDAAVDWICSKIRQMTDECLLDWEKCIGVGISSPGPLDYKKGVILTPPDFRLFSHYPIVERMKAKLGRPASLENNPVLSAVMEYQSSAMDKYSQIMFIIIKDGIGVEVLPVRNRKADPGI
jgi:predicted NBD/HSP70 family sugar kinase